jgi:hypothetical protein
LRPAPTIYKRVLLVDINDGGLVGDLVLLRQDGTIEALRQQSQAGTFAAPDVYPGAGVAASGLVFGDVNGDGHGDLLILRAQSQSIVLRRGSQAEPGKLLDALDLGIDITDVSALAIADVNLDGLNDVVARGIRRVRAFRQDPLNHGAFLEGIELLAPSGVSLLAAPLGPDADLEILADDREGVLRLPLSAPRRRFP